MKQTICKKCNRPIGWCVSENGRPMPIDIEPNAAGNVIVGYREGRLVGVVLSKNKPRPEGQAHMPHYATCPARKPAKPRPVPPVAPDLFNQQGEPNA